MRLKLILCALVLATLAMPAVADEVDDLILDLKYGGQDARENAVLALGESGDPRAIDPLIEALKDKDVQVRLWAASDLGDFGDPKAVAPLIEALKDERPVVQLWAASSLVKLGKAEYFNRITAMLDNGDPYLYSEVIMALGETGDPRAIDPLIEAFNYADTGDCRAELPDFECRLVYMYAVFGLVGFDDPRVVAPLTDVLRDGASELRVSAAQALGNIGDPQAIGALTYVAQKDGDPKVREAAKEALEKIGDPRTVDQLIEALKDEDGLAREGAVTALGETGDPRAIDPLIEALKDEDWLVRSSAARALGEIGDARAVAPLIGALKDEYARVRSSAARALGEIGDARAVAPLTEALKDESVMYMASSGTYETVREAAAEALEKIQAE
ncbi:MAG: HEAT repeat domain-containing protein [Methanothrix sp.]|nr:HEAT repeat domain-containing protein [Methanothrix sp.]